VPESGVTARIAVGPAPTAKIFGQTGHGGGILRRGICCFYSPRPRPTCRAVNDDEITPILQRIEQGDPLAAEQLLPLVYDELRRLAAAKMAREAPGHTLQPTALVHEVWLRLGGDGQPAWSNRAHFFAAAAQGMRRILIESARRKRAVRHGGTVSKISADATGFDVASPTQDDEELLLLNEAIDSLAAHDPRKAELVKQKYFVGLTLEEAADVLGISHRTAKRDWAYARAWLFNEVKRLRG
jgi:RNA polymerase sigma factor (TIGR02999 family)